MIEILLVGDVAPIQREANAYIHIEYTLDESIRNILNKADIVIGNLETAITGSLELDKSKLAYRITPERADKLKIFNLFTYMNIANNHIFDYGYIGMQDTIHYLDNHDILHTGAGDNLEQAEQYVIIERDNIKIAIYSAADHPSEWKCSSNRKGCINYLPFNTDETIQKIVAVVKKIHNDTDVDLIIFSYHYGPNYKNSIEQYENFMYKILETGIDIIHGHSAHHINRISKYIIGQRKCYIIYSNGEFINDYGWPDADRTRYLMDYSMIVRITVTTENQEQLLHLTIIPTKLHYTHTNDLQYYAGVESAQLRLANQNEKKIIKCIAIGSRNNNDNDNDNINDNDNDNINDNDNDNDNELSNCHSLLATIPGLLIKR